MQGLVPTPDVDRIDTNVHGGFDVNPVTLWPVITECLWTHGCINSHTLNCCSAAFYSVLYAR